MTTTSINLDDIVTRTLEDVKYLESQIKILLRTMEVAENINSVAELSLPEPKSTKEGERPDVRMEWSGPTRGKKSYKGNVTTVPETSAGVSNLRNGMEELSSLDVMELCIRESITKYEAVEDSVFFVPVFDRCVFGMTLRNVSNKKLRSPSVSLSLVPWNTTRHKHGECFIYNVQVRLKDVNPETSGRATGILFQGTFSNFNGDIGSGSVMTGCEAQVSATFPCPSQFFRDNEFSLLVSVFLEEQQLWSRVIYVNDLYFNAASVDSIFKRHHIDILMALGNNHQTFKMERILSQDGSTPKRSLEKFLFPLGYECILSKPNGNDSFVHFYASNQPSVYWGSSLKVETCTRKPSVICCLVSTRTEEQMRLLYHQFQLWLLKEVGRERKYGTGSGPHVTPLCPKVNTMVVNKIESEIQLILRLQDVKSILTCESIKSQKRKQNSSFSEIGTIDSNWIHEYCLCVTKTDEIFVKKM